MSEGENKALIEELNRLKPIHTVEIENGKKVLVLIDGNGKRHVESLKPFIDEYRESPQRCGKASLRTLASFIAHANRFKSEHSALFAVDNPKEPTLSSVLDYHEKGHDGAPALGTHRGVYSFPVSDEWTAWTGVNERDFTQDALADFLERRILDLVEPGSVLKHTGEIISRLGISIVGAVSVLQLSKGMAIRVDSKVQNAFNPSTGETTISYQEGHTDAAGQPLKVPGGFVIGVPVFRGGAPFQIPVRIRYKVHGGAIKWKLLLQGHEAAFRLAFTEACEEAAKATDLPLFYGAPES